MNTEEFFSHPALAEPSEAVLVDGMVHVHHNGRTLKLKRLPPQYTGAVLDWLQTSIAASAPLAPAPLKQSPWGIPVLRALDAACMLCERDPRGERTGVAVLSRTPMSLDPAASAVVKALQGAAQGTTSTALPSRL